MAFDVKYSLTPRTEGYMIYKRTYTANTDCIRGRLIDEKKGSRQVRKRRKKGEKRADAAVLEQPGLLWQSAEPSETHCQDQGKWSKALQQRNRYRARRGGRRRRQGSFPQWQFLMKVSNTEQIKHSSEPVCIWTVQTQHLLLFPPSSGTQLASPTRLIETTVCWFH